MGTEMYKMLQVHSHDSPFQKKNFAQLFFFLPYSVCSIHDLFVLRTFNILSIQGKPLMMRDVHQRIIMVSS